jgi:hypothetical protein
MSDSTADQNKTSKPTSTADLVLIIVIVVVALVILITILFFIIKWWKKSKRNVNKTQVSSKNNVEVKVEVLDSDKNSKNIQKPFIKGSNEHNRINSHSVSDMTSNLSSHANNFAYKVQHYKDETTIDMSKNTGIISATDRKLLAMENPKSKRIETDSTEKVKKQNVKNLKKEENNFREQINKIHLEDDGGIGNIKKMAEKKKKNTYLKNNIDVQKDKTSKDIAMDNLQNFTDGNREDFFSEASREDDEDVVSVKAGKHYIKQNPLEMIKFNNQKSSVPVHNIITYNKKPQGQRHSSVKNERDMTPEERSDFMDEDEEENADYYKNIAGNFHSEFNQRNREGEYVVEFKRENSL